jgi:putative ABC transport system permease protein
MLKNYIITAWRNLVKSKFYSIINIAGLTAGLAIGMLILLWVQDELSFDSFHKKANNIYRLELFGGTGESRQIWPLGVGPIGPLSKMVLPQIEDFVRITRKPDLYPPLYSYHDKVFNDENAVFADPSFFSVFDFNIIQGNLADPFPNDNSMVITEKTAERYFGNSNPIGKIISTSYRENFTVSGVIKNFPDNSSINCDMVMPISHFISHMPTGADFNADFTNFNYETYLLLKPGTDLKSLALNIKKVHLAHKSDDTYADYLLLPLTKMHLYNADLSDKGAGTVRIFIIIALLILIIACINYVNLSTARSMLRAKEISMRKIVGAAKSHLFMQFIIETALLFLMAATIAIGLMFILMPFFNQISNKRLIFNLADYRIWLVILATITGTLAASSIYPALLLSSFEPLTALKGKISAGIGNVFFRKILVITQFVFSIVLIVGTIVITGQLNYIRSKDLGYDKANVFMFDMRNIGRNYDAARAELLKQPGVLNVTASSGPIVNIGGQDGTPEWDGKPANSTFIVHPMTVDKDFISFFKLKILAGSAFTGVVSDQAHFILNEAAVKEINMKNPIGKRFKIDGNDGTIIGVVKDFHFASMKEKIGPTVFSYTSNFLPYIYIKTTGRDAPKAINAAGAQFKHYNSEYPFNYRFLDEIFDNLYKGEQTEGKLFIYFATIAVFISCLGLLGLVAYTAQVRTREIGVRRVLGASVSRIVGLLAQDFIKLVFVAIVIAMPLSWVAMNNWLQAFAYRVNIGWWVFAIAGLTSLAIAFITISFQAIKAALANPVESLRNQ